MVGLHPAVSSGISQDGRQRAAAELQQITVQCAAFLITKQHTCRTAALEAQSAVQAAEAELGKALKAARKAVADRLGIPPEVLVSELTVSASATRSIFWVVAACTF